MPHVASETQSHAVKFTQPRAQKAAPPAERSPSTAFESMLDDNATAAADRAPRPDDARSARADRTQDSAPPNKAKPAKSADAASDDKRPAAADKPKDKDTDAKADKADGAGKTEAAGKDAPAKTDGDAKTADAKATDKPAVDPALVAAAIDAATQPAAPPVPAVAAAVPTPAPVVADTPKIVAADGLLAGQAAKVQGQDGTQADAQAGTQAAGDVKTADGKADETLLKAAKAHADGKPMHAEPTDADKDQISQARGEAPAHAQRNGDQAPPAAADVGPTAGKPAHDAAAPHVSQVQALTNNAAPAATPATPAQPAVQQPAVPLGGVAVEIASKAAEGKNHFEIRLDPPELGRIDVRLDVDRDGHVTSRLIVDRQDTLDLLRRDATGLERALQDAGLKTSDNGMQFSLRDQTAEQQQQRQTGGENARLVVDDEALPAADLTVQSYGRLAGRAGGLDIRV